MALRDRRAGVEGETGSEMVSRGGRQTRKKGARFACRAPRDDGCYPVANPNSATRLRYRRTSHRIRYPARRPRRQYFHPPARDAGGDSQFRPFVRHPALLHSSTRAPCPSGERLFRPCLRSRAAWHGPSTRIRDLLWPLGPSPGVPRSRYPENRLVSSGGTLQLKCHETLRACAESPDQTQDTGEWIPAAQMEATTTMSRELSGWNGAVFRGRCAAMRNTFPILGKRLHR